MSKSLDSGNRHTYLLFHLQSGLVISSKDSHFHNVPLNLISKIELRTKYYVYSLDKQDLPASFKEFVHFRSAGNTVVQTQEGVHEVLPILTWSLGWTDGFTEYLQEYDFKSGKHLRSYELPRDINSNKSHFHPDSEDFV